MNLSAFAPTPLYLLYTDERGNRVFIKREDLLPYSFGGNKARIGAEYLADLKQKGCTHLVAYGNARSNLCRILSNLCAGENIPITILCPADDDGEHREAFNGTLCRALGASIVPCLKTNVAQTVDRVLADIEASGGKPYYIYGDRLGQGNLDVPVRAYQKAWAEIEAQCSVPMDKIILALGTGMTQAGLLCGMKDAPHKPEVIGVSIARDAQNASRHIENYMRAAGVAPYGIHVCDTFRSGYGQYDETVETTIRQTMARYGVPLDGTYTAKAMLGLEALSRDWQNQNILFLHTGGTPLFFDSQR